MAHGFKHLAVKEINQMMRKGIFEGGLCPCQIVFYLQVEILFAPIKQIFFV